MVYRLVRGVARPGQLHTLEDFGLLILVPILPIFDDIGLNEVSDSQGVVYCRTYRRHDMLP